MADTFHSTLCECECGHNCGNRGPWLLYEQYLDYCKYNNISRGVINGNRFVLKKCQQAVINTETVLHIDNGWLITKSPYKRK